MIDEIDAKILNIIQENSRTPNAEIARQVGMAPSAILERIRKLEERGLIQGYTVRLNARALGLGLLAYVFVRTDDRVGKVSTAEKLAEIPEVQEIHHIAGEDCYLAKVRTADTKSLGRLLREQFGAIKSIISTRTTIVLETIKESTTLPLQSEDEEEAHA
jgi:Lrp/AsnC family leucine-responsive transcriptional regulator